MKTTKNYENYKELSIVTQELEVPIGNNDEYIVASFTLFLFFLLHWFFKTFFFYIVFRSVFPVTLTLYRISRINAKYTNIPIQLYQYNYINTNVSIQMYQYKCINTNVSIQIGCFLLNLLWVPLHIFSFSRHYPWLHKTIKVDSYLRMRDKRRTSEAGGKRRIARWVIRAVLPRADDCDDTQSFIVLIPKKWSRSRIFVPSPFVFITQPMHPHL